MPFAGWRNRRHARPAASYRLMLIIVVLNVECSMLVLNIGAGAQTAIAKPTARHQGPMVISLKAHVMETVNQTAVLVVPFMGYPQDSTARLELTVQAQHTQGSCVQDHETLEAHFERHQFSIEDLIDGKILLGMPDLKPCHWLMHLQVRDTFPGLSEDESLLSSRTISWQQPTQSPSSYTSAQRALKKEKQQTARSTHNTPLPRDQLRVSFIEPTHKAIIAIGKIASVCDC